jgi:hypothetical protein
LADSERERIMSELPERREASGLAPMREHRRAGT